MFVGEMPKSVVNVSFVMEACPCGCVGGRRWAMWWFGREREKGRRQMEFFRNVEKNYRLMMITRVQSCGSKLLARFGSADVAGSR